MANRTHAIQRVRVIGLLLLILLFGSAWASPPPSPLSQPTLSAPPQRIVSLNACTDQLLLALAPRERIVALTYLATRKEVSALWREAQGIDQVRGSAEEVLTLRPDLVLAGQFTTRHTVYLLKQFGIPVMVLAPADDFATVRDQIRQIAQLLGETARGEAMITELDQQLAQWSNLPTRLGAFYRQGGYTSGRNTLVDAVMQAARMNNVAAEFGIRGTGYLPLEQLLIARPEWLITSDYKRDVPTMGLKLLQHPVLRDMPGGEFILPGNLTSCGGLWNSRAVWLLAGLAAVR